MPRDEWIEIPVVAFLVEHPAAGPILIDTGFHAAVAVDPSRASGALGGLLFKDLRMEAEQAVPAQLRERGIDPSDVRDRGHDPPALRPRQRHRGVPGRDLRA